MLSILRRLRDEESGAFIAIFIAVLLGLLLCAAFVIDIGNWKEHDRHLQLQVDDGALAAGTAFSGCFVFPETANARVEAFARRYAGDPGVGGSYNRQVNHPDRDPNHVALALNSAQFPPERAPTGSWTWTATATPSRHPVRREDARRQGEGLRHPVVLRPR